MQNTNQFANQLFTYKLNIIFVPLGHTQTSDRKKDHIELAFESVVANQDSRFYYEPLFSGHPQGELEPVHFAGKQMKAPLWVSSMTGGTKEAGIINKNLARACGQFGLGMGLGSCRIILKDDEYLPDFQLRKEMGDYPLYANLGVAQLEELKGGALFLVSERQYALTELGRSILPETLDLLARANGWLSGQSEMIDGLQYLRRQDPEMGGPATRPGSRRSRRNANQRWWIADKSKPASLCA